MSSISISGVTTLIALIVVSPFFYGIQHLLQANKNNNNMSNHDDKQQKLDDDEKSTNNEVDQKTVSDDDIVSSSNSDDDDSETNKENKEERETYSLREYLFAMIGYAIGIGNVWRFPYVIANNGGSAALVAYIICAIFVAIPLYMYEMILGQHLRLSSISAFEVIRKRWKSLAYAMFLMLFIVEGYYAMIIAYTFPYIWNSLKDPLPWVGRAESFWRHDVLNSFDDLDDKPAGPGPVQGTLAISLILLWIITYLSTAFGKKILAKITYVTVLLPIVLILLLVARNVFLEGAGDGIAFYIGKFEASRLLDLRVWATACSQILFSLSPGFGTAITLSSFTKPKEDMYKACWIVAICNSMFSIIGGFAVFAMVGHLAFREGLPVEEVATRSGTGLAFITIAEAMTYFGSFANVMSVLFFSMLFLLGLDSAYAWLETIVLNIEDFMAQQGWQKRPTWQTTGIVVLIMIIMGLTFATRLGNEALDVMDHFVGTLGLLFLVSFEALMLNLDFGWERMEYALRKATIGNKETPDGRTLFPKWFCRIDFHCTTVLIPFLMCVDSIVRDLREPYEGYPTSLLVWGWGLLGLIMVTAVATIWKRDESTLPPFSMEELLAEHDHGRQSTDHDEEERPEEEP